MMKRVAILQSNYIPWKGYFDLINMVDEFILYDDVQYTRRDWRNRNKIKSPQGELWLTISVNAKGKYDQKICETEVNDKSWADNHWKTIVYNYAKAKHFKEIYHCLEPIYKECKEISLLSRINYRFIYELCGLLGIKTKISWSSDYTASGGRSERLLELCKQAGADEYLSGPAAQSYLDEQLFLSQGVQVRWMNYEGYREYSQLFPPFTHGVSIIDLLMNEGADGAKKFMLSFKETTCNKGNGKIYKRDD